MKRELYGIRQQKRHKKDEKTEQLSEIVAGANARINLIIYLHLEELKLKNDEGDVNQE